MIYLLDTNACIHHLKFADSPITRKLTIHLPETAVCSVTKAELFYEAMRSNNPTQSMREQQAFLALFVSPYRRGFVLLFPSFYRRRVDDILNQCEVALGGWAIGIILST